MDSVFPLPRRVLFPKKRAVLPKYAQNFGESSGFDKGDAVNSKAKIQFEHDLEASLRSFEKELHQQRLESLRHASEKLQDDIWKYPDLESNF